MGWMYTHREKGISQREFFGQLFDSESGHIVDIASTGNCAYIAYSSRRPDHSRVIEAIAVEFRWVPGDYYNFGYKDACESAGPIQDACPKRILERLSPLEEIYSDPEHGRHAAAWRERCWERIEKRARRPKVSCGDRVIFPNDYHFEDGLKAHCFVARDLRRNEFVPDGFYSRYKLPRSWREENYRVEPASPDRD